MEWLQERLQLAPGLFDAPLFTLAGTPVTAATLIVFAVIIGLTFLISHLIQKAVARALRTPASREA